MRIKYLAISIFIFFGCSNPDKIVEATDIDKELASLLEATSNGKGKSFYELPLSDIFLQIPQDPLNPLTNVKVKLGQFLFHETGLAQNPKKGIGMSTYSCASCHHARAGFQACLPQGMGEGGMGFGVNGESRKKNDSYDALNEVDVQHIRTPSAMNIAYQTNVL